jgi:hypothetical protein
MADHPQNAMRRLSSVRGDLRLPPVDPSRHRAEFHVSFGFYYVRDRVLVMLIVPL